MYFNDLYISLKIIRDNRAGIPYIFLMQTEQLTDAAREAGQITVTLDRDSVSLNRSADVVIYNDDGGVRYVGQIDSRAQVGDRITTRNPWGGPDGPTFRITDRQTPVTGSIILSLLEAAR